MRRTYAHRFFHCEKCSEKFGKVVEISPEEVLVQPCPCGGSANQEQRQASNETRFQPFWSDTMQCRINDREDLKKLKQYAKDNGLVCVGHMNQKPDRAAIRHNYEND